MHRSFSTPRHTQLNMQFDNICSGFLELQSLQSLHHQNEISEFAMIFVATSMPVTSSLARQAFAVFHGYIDRVPTQHHVTLSQRTARQI